MMETLEMYFMVYPTINSFLEFSTNVTHRATNFAKCLSKTIKLTGIMRKSSKHMASEKKHFTQFDNGKISQ